MLCYQGEWSTQVHEKTSTLNSILIWDLGKALGKRAVEVAIDTALDWGVAGTMVLLAASAGGGASWDDPEVRCRRVLCFRPHSRQVFVDGHSFVMCFLLRQLMHKWCDFTCAWHLDTDISVKTGQLNRPWNCTGQRRQPERFDVVFRAWRRRKIIYSLSWISSDVV